MHVQCTEIVLPENVCSIVINLLASIGLRLVFIHLPFSHLIYRFRQKTVRLKTLKSWGEIDKKCLKYCLTPRVNELDL